MRSGFGFQTRNGINPSHIAIILDGQQALGLTSRKSILGWVTSRVLKPWSNCWIGFQNVRRQVVTLYTFSTENFHRPSGEVEEIMRIAAEKFRKLLTDERNTPQQSSR